MDYSTIGKHIPVLRFRDPWYFRVILAEMLILREQVVEHPESGLQVQVDNVLGSGLRFRKPRVLHQVEGKANIGHTLLKRLKANKFFCSQFLGQLNGKMKVLNVNHIAWILSLTLVPMSSEEAFVGRHSFFHDSWKVLQAFGYLHAGGGFFRDRCGPMGAVHTTSYLAWA